MKPLRIRAFQAICKTVIIILLLAVGAIYVFLIQEAFALKKPCIIVEKINSSPSNYYRTNNLNPLDSVLFNKDKDGKWKNNFVYVYKIQKAKWFQWDEYKNSHKNDGVDGGINRLIFSDQPADPQIFDIQEAAGH